MTTEEPSANGSYDWPITDQFIHDAFAALFQDGSWGRYHGPHGDRLRSELAAYHGVEHVILCSSGTCAIELALRAAQVQPHDEVILAAYDFKANFSNVLTLGAVPVLVDTLPGLPVLNPDHLTDALTVRTRAIVCSHLHGSLAPMRQILDIAGSHGVLVIEDACQSHGAVLQGRVTGSAGHLGVLSFGGSKLLTAGRGGAILTSDPLLAQRIRLYTQRGNDAYPMSEMQAAVLLPQLLQLNARNRIRLRNVQALLERWPADCALQPAINGLQNLPEDKPAFYKLAFRWQPTSPNYVPRDAVAANMRAHGIPLDPAFAALHRIHSHRRFRAIGELPHATALHDQLMTLHHPVLLNDLETQRMAERMIELVPT